MWSYTMLKSIFKSIVESQWVAGMKVFLSGVTPKIIFSSLTLEGKKEFVDIFLEVAHARLQNTEILDLLERAYIS